ncbi:MAG: hypothetical protein ACYCUG_01100 [Acidimicrobiales bacterium]
MSASCARRLGLLVLAAALAGCGGTGLALGPRSVSACYRSIPAAVAAVHDSDARLLGVHHLPLVALRRRNASLLAAWPGGDPTVCAVALEGPFAPGQVDGAPPSARGRYALVVLEARSGRVLGSTVTNYLPRRLLGRTY